MIVVLKGTAVSRASEPQLPGHEETSRGARCVAGSTHSLQMSARVLCASQLAHATALHAHGAQSWLVVSPQRPSASALDVRACRRRRRRTALTTVAG